MIHRKNRIWRRMIAKVASGLVVPGLLCGAMLIVGGCANEHISDNHGKAYTKIFRQQRIYRETEPWEMLGADSEIAMENMRAASTAKDSGRTSRRSSVQLLPIQR